MEAVEAELALVVPVLQNLSEPAFSKHASKILEFLHPVQEALAACVSTALWREAPSFPSYTWGPGGKATLAQPLPLFFSDQGQNPPQTEVQPPPAVHRRDPEIQRQQRSGEQRDIYCISMVYCFCCFSPG